MFATFGLVALSSQFLPMAMQAPAVVLLIGLAVGVDYSMFYLKREREERAAGRSPRAAVEAAAATSGRSVLVSGLIVMTAMAGMFLTGNEIFASIAIATIAVVAIAVLGSLTVLPALLSRLGDNVDRLRVPLVRRLRRDDGKGRMWGAIVDQVMRRPVLAAVLSGGLLVALAIPAFQLHLASPSPETYPESLAAVQTYIRMQEAFPGTALPGQRGRQGARRECTGRAGGDSGARRACARERPHARADHGGRQSGCDGREHHGADGGNGEDAVSDASLAALRDDIVPATVGALPDAETGVTGLTANWTDSTDEIKSKLPLVFAFVLLFAFVLMLVAFRSLVIAAKAIVLNLLSVAAAYGVLVLVFQHGIGKDFLGFSSTEGISPEIPLLLFVILFGLSMDYHVFILSRIREAVRPRGRERRSDRLRDQVDRRRRHECRDRDGLRVRDLRDALDAVLQAVRRRARRGGPDRRDDRQGRAPAGVDEAARRLELVPAELARVAASLRPGEGEAPPETKPTPVSA